jgi:hypothetical protein
MIKLKTIKLLEKEGEIKNQTKRTKLKLLLLLLLF